MLHLSYSCLGVGGVKCPLLLTVQQQDVHVGKCACDVRLHCNDIRPESLASAQQQSSGVHCLEELLFEAPGKGNEMQTMQISRGTAV